MRGSVAGGAHAPIEVWVEGEALGHWVAGVPAMPACARAVVWDLDLDLARV